ncbi:MAG TPA: hypothetical protein VNZ22_16595, partial [Bacillota bacterium]|nr:hypothetical protein [Bacillota bacterium]
RLAAADYARKELDPGVIGALGGIGSAASNAVPLLSAIAADQAVRSRWLAVRALGDIGPSARPAAPILGALLAKQGAVNDFALLTAVARIGGTPKEAVPPLQQVFARGNPLCQVMAAVALWNFEPTNPEFQKNVSAFLQASLEAAGRVAHPASAEPLFLAGPLLATLRVHGTNAVVFAPVIRQLVQRGHPSLTNLAAITLQQLEPVTPVP